MLLRLGPPRSGFGAGAGSQARRAMARGGAVMLLVILLAGCATSYPEPAAGRRFDFQKDTFAFANDLVWEYHEDENGDWVHRRREPPPDYTHHCFAVARSARQFLQHARFDPSQPVAGEATYRWLIRRVVASDPRQVRPEAERIVIPGYASLREFSADREGWLKEECGGAWQSYFQRGNWRMILPFSRDHQAHTAEQLVADLKLNRPPLVHLVRFPQLSINHLVLLFDAAETDRGIVFSVYDPNQPAGPTTLSFDRATRTFEFPANDYFPGGRVDVYEVYCGWNY